MVEPRRPGTTTPDGPPALNRHVTPDPRPRHLDDHINFTQPVQNFDLSDLVGWTPQ